MNLAYVNGNITQDQLPPVKDNCLTDKLQVRFVKEFHYDDPGKLVCFDTSFSSLTIETLFSQF